MTAQDLTRRLARRRRELGMPYDALAASSGVSIPTLKRILTRPESDPTFSNVLAAADALGLDLILEPTATATEMRRRQAEKKAREGLRRVQATSGLETQALKDDELKELFEQAVHDWMAGSKNKLWAQ